MSQFDLIRKINALEARITALENRSQNRESLAEQYRQKFGKKPHHFMSEERIMEALEALRVG